MTIFQFWSSNSAQLSSHPTSCKLVTVFIIMFFTCVVRLTHMLHVWVPRRRLYDSSALHIVGEIIHISLLSSGLSPGETPSETKPSAVLCCNRHISLDSFRHALHTEENFSPVHFGCVLLAENRHYTYEYQGVTMGQRTMISVFVFTSSTNFMGVFFVPVSHSCSLLFHYKNYMKRESSFFITNSTCMHIFCVT